MPNVDDHGLEVLKKAARNLSPTPKKDYALQTLLVNESGSNVANITGEKRLQVEAATPQAAYQTLSFLHLGSSALNINGATTPVEFIAQPQPTQIVFVESLQMILADDGPFNVNGFGGLPALTNGVVLECKSNGIVYTTKILFNNADVFSFFSSNPIFVDKTSLGGSDSFYSGDWELQRRMVIDPSKGDYLKMIVRDNLTGLANFSVHAKTFSALAV